MATLPTLPIEIQNKIMIEYKGFNPYPFNEEFKSYIDNILVEWEFIVNYHRNKHQLEDKNREWVTTFGMAPIFESINFVFDSHKCVPKKNKVLFLHQVDNFAIACEDVELANSVISDINNSMSIEIKHLGKVTRYNGVDVEQQQEYIKLHNATYIDKLIAQHEWLQRDSKSMHSYPLPMDATPKYLHDLETAEPLTNEEKHVIEAELQFTYRQAVGEIIYAMITCRPDISFAIIKLSQYSTKPAAIHYEALKQLYRYLKATKYHGIYYWRQTRREVLPKGDIPVLYNANNYDETNVHERQTKHPHILQTYVDSDHASDCTHRRSVTGFHCKLAGGVVLFKTQLQSIVAQSSTEAEFIAAAEAGKNILYLRTIMDELGISQDQASILYEDNQGALLMAQAGQPTKRTKHIDVKHFAIQSWVEQDLIAFKRIATSDNSADVLTKATPRTLFYRHTNHIMGQVIPQYVTYVTQTKKDIPTTFTSQINVIAQNIYISSNTKAQCKGGCNQVNVYRVGMGVEGEDSDDQDTT